MKEKIKDLLKTRKAILLAHNYQLPEVQDIADLTGDSLELSIKAAQTDEALADEFLRLARQKQQELAMVQEQIKQLRTGQEENSSKPAQILELAQHLADQYVTLPSPKKRQIVNSTFLNLQLDDVNLCAEYRLPFSILAENAHRPLDYAWEDSNPQPSVP